MRYGDDLPYANRYISVLTITDRKVTHWRDYLDPLAVVDALAAARQRFVGRAGRAVRGQLTSAGER